MKFDVGELARMIDLSAVRADVDLAEVQRLAEVCAQYQCACAFVMPCYMPQLKKWLADAPTGWAPTGATLHNVRLIKQTVGDRAQVKAAGGVRDLETIVEMHQLGVTRFGLGIESGIAMLEECAASARKVNV